MRIEDLSKRPIIPPTQYLQSFGTSIDKSGSSDKVTTYFFPSMVFPNKIELLSVTLMHKNDSGSDKLVHLAVLDGKTPTDMPEKFTLVHNSGKLITTLTFPTLVLEAERPFYFYHKEGELEDSCVVLSFRNYG